MSNELYHHGVKGMKWGVRRYQNKDGTLTSAGRKQYDDKTTAKKAVKEYSKKYNRAISAQDKVDKKWKETHEMYISLGRNEVERMFNAARNKSDAAKKYSRAYDEASKMADEADELWKDAKESYKKTGSNRIARVVNNAKYAGFKN